VLEGNISRGRDVASSPLEVKSCNEASIALAVACHYTDLSVTF
jgi:hypothetical protein